MNNQITKTDKQVEDKSALSRFSRFVKLVFINVLLLFILLCFLELVLRVTRQDKYSINRLRLSFSYYEMFAAAPVKSKYVNIVPVSNVTTKRITPTNPGKGARVFMFGGSTTMGFNDPTNPEMADNTTIASHLATAMKDAGSPMIVENFGVGSSRSSEELAKLIKLLRAGERPDYVIFYDGYNDAEFAIRGQVVHDFMRPAADIMVSYVSDEYCEKGLRQFELYKLLDRLPMLQGVVRGMVVRILRRKPGGDYRFYDVYARIDGNSPTLLSGATAYCTSNYEENAKIVRALGSLYGFQVFFVLQPMIYFKQPLAEREKEVLEKLPLEFRERTPIIFNGIAEVMSVNRDFYRITDVFNGVTNAVFVDQGHVMSEGNRIVALRLSSILSEAVKKRQLGKCD